jgi:hypothetical protein
MGEAVDDVEVAFVVLEGVPQVAMVEASIPDKLVYLRVVLDVAIGRVDGNLMGPPCLPLIDICSGSHHLEKCLRGENARLIDRGPWYSSAKA